MSSRRLIVYLLLMLVLFFVLRPRRSWENLKQMYTYRRWLWGIASTVILLYILYGLWQIYSVGLWWW